MGRERHRGPRRPIGRDFEVLESRDLPSALHAPAAPSHAHRRAPAATTDPAGGGGASSSGQSPNVSVGSYTVNLAGATNNTYSTSSMISGAPTRHERLRDNFTAVFYGPYVIGPPRFTGDTSQTYTNSGGTSSSFLKGNLQLGFETPSSTAQGPAGTATLYPKNYLMTGNFLVLQLQGDPTDARDGRATSFSYTVLGTSSGMYSNASGAGTVQLVYHPGSPDGGILHANGLPTGNVSVIIRGTLILDGTVNPLRLGSA